jgi:serine/threonine-protein kinase
MIGKTVQQYQFIEKLGAGGMGEIYKALDTRLNRFVAIKVLPPGSSADPGRRSRFVQEAQAASALNHPNIITIYDIISDDNTQYMVMEYIAGRTLLDVIPKGGLRVPLVLRYGTQMADALATAHAAGIIHRDLKPSNIMITDAGLVKLLDFGLAKLGERPSPVTSPDAATVLTGPLTVEGTVMGTVNYMSPEQAEGKKVDARSDIFSFGSLLYEMATGNCAFDGTSSISTLSAVLRDDVRSLAEVAPDVPPQLESIITRCLKKDPDQRWQTMHEVRMALEALRKQSDSGVLYKTLPVSPPVPTPAPVAAPAPAAAKKGSSGALVAIFVVLGVLVLLGVAGAGAWWWMTQRKATPPAEVSRVITTPPPASAAPPAAAQAAPPEAAPPPPASEAASSTAPSPAKRAPVAATPAQMAVKKPAAPSRPVPRTTPVTVADGLPFRIALAEDIPADAQDDRPVRFTATEAVRVGDAIVIAQGATVTGAIADAGKKKFLGMGSKLSLRLVNVNAVDGHKLSVRATSGRAAGGAARRPVDVGGKGKSKEIAAAAGSQYIGYIDGAQTVMVPKQ